MYVPPFSYGPLSISPRPSILLAESAYEVCVPASNEKMRQIEVDATDHGLRMVRTS